jgi:hypothetical protein
VGNGHGGRHGELILQQNVRVARQLSKGHEQGEESNGILATCADHRGAGEPRVRSQHGRSEPYERRTATERNSGG